MNINQFEMTYSMTSTMVFSVEVFCSMILTRLLVSRALFERLKYHLSKSWLLWSLHSYNSSPSCSYSITLIHVKSFGKKYSQDLRYLIENSDIFQVILQILKSYPVSL